MRVSLFTLNVARGAELPAPQAVAQSETLVVETQDQGPAAQVESTTVANDPDAHPGHVSDSVS